MEDNTLLENAKTRIEETVDENGNPKRVFYIDIGDCLPEKAEELMNRLKEHLSNKKGKND